MKVELASPVPERGESAGEHAERAGQRGAVSYHFRAQVGPTSLSPQPLRLPILPSAFVQESTWERGERTARDETSGYEKGGVEEKRGADIRRPIPPYVLFAPRSESSFLGSWSAKSKSPAHLLRSIFRVRVSTTTFATYQASRSNRNASIFLNWINVGRKS